MYKFPRIDWRFYWLGLAGLMLLLRYILSINPAFAELVYARGVYAVIRYVYDYTLGWLPIPFLYVALLALLGWGGWRWYRWRKQSSREHRPLRNRMGSFLLSILAVVAMVVVLFLGLWGYNYYRVPVHEQLGLEASGMNPQKVRAEAALATRQLIERYQQLRLAAGERASERLPVALERATRESLEEVLKATGYPTPGRVRCRQVFPKGLMMRLGATGIYIPMVGEGHIDGGLHPLARPFTMTHEMAHAYGFGDEATANFWAYLGTQANSDPAIQYAGALSYWRYAAGQLLRIDPNQFEKMVAQLPEGIRTDWQDIRKTHAQYPAFFPLLFDRIYDSFLKSQGVQDGVASYSRVVSLVVAWREQAASS